MKWLSLKEHKPPKKKAIFICYGLKSQWIGCAYVEGEIDRFYATLAPYEFENVTHFCIPDPVEIEEEK